MFILPSAATIWTNGDFSEQISDFNGEYILITTTDMKKTTLGSTLEEVKEKLMELGRYDIIKQLG